MSIIQKILKFLRKCRDSNLLLGLIFLFIAYQTTNYFFILDTTSDKRYSLQSTSKKIINSLEDDIRIDVYLGGELPVELKYLKSAVHDFIVSLNRNVKKPKIKLNFIDLETLDEEERYHLIKQFRLAEIHPTTFQFKKGAKTIEKAIYPVAKIHYVGRDEYILLLKSTTISNIASMLQSSIENLEYEIVSAIEMLTITNKYKIGILRDHGTPLDNDIKDLLNEVEKYYTYKPIFLRQLETLQKEDLDMLIIISPTERFSENELYLIDQYIMKGGHTLFFIDRLSINLREIYEGRNFAIPIESGIEDLLYKYGIVIRAALIQDLQCSVQPYVKGYLGNQPQLTIIPWTFNPIFTHCTIHPVVKNIDSLLGRFVSPLSIIETEGVHYVGLIYTSPNTMLSSAPFILNVENLYKTIPKELYKEGYIPISIIAEGQFTSAFATEILLPEIADKQKFLKDSKHSRIFVSSTSSLITNYINPLNNKIEKLGYDPFLKKEFSNAVFMQNILRFFSNPDGAIGLEKKSYKIRLLDMVYVEKNRLKIQLTVILLPIAVLVLIGLIFNAIRRRKYGR